MSGFSVTIVDTGLANIASVLAAFRRLGVEPVVSGVPGGIESAPAVVLPGVGAFGPGMERLRSTGLDEALRERIDTGLPTLAICLGMQLLGESSEESPGAEGLGVARWSAARFGEGVRVPQFGWNRVEAGEGCTVLESGYAYFANSFRIELAGPDWITATTDHGGRFVSAAERGSVVVCQFHPELSGAWGTGLLGRWLETAKVGSTTGGGAVC